MGWPRCGWSAWAGGARLRCGRRAAGWGGRVGGGWAGGGGGGPRGGRGAGGGGRGAGGGGPGARGQWVVVPVGGRLRRGRDRTRGARKRAAAPGAGEWWCIEPVAC